MEIKNQTKEKEQRLIEMMSLAFKRIAQLETQVAELTKEKTDSDTGVFVSTNDEYKKHIFTEERDI